MPAANAWSVRRNASACRHREGSGFMCGAIAALYMRKRRPTTKHVRIVTAIGAPAAMSCAARICAAPENMIADKPQRFVGRSARRLRADSADEAERQRADERRRHVADAGDEIRAREDPDKE